MKFYLIEAVDPAARKARLDKLIIAGNKSWASANAILRKRDAKYGNVMGRSRSGRTSMYRPVKSKKQAIAQAAHVALGSVARKKMDRASRLFNIAARREFKGSGNTTNTSNPYRVSKDGRKKYTRDRDREPNHVKAMARRYVRIKLTGK